MHRRRTRHPARHLAVISVLVLAVLLGGATATTSVARAQAASAALSQGESAARRVSAFSAERLSLLAARKAHELEVAIERDRVRRQIELDRMVAASRPQRSGEVVATFSGNRVDVARTPPESGSPPMQVLRRSTVEVAIASAGEKRLVTLQVPSVLRPGPGSNRQVMGQWRVVCVPGEGEPGRVVTSEADDGDATSSKSTTRNLLAWDASTVTVRSLFTFTLPGTYACHGSWGARSSVAVQDDRVTQISAQPGTLTVSDVLNDDVDAKQCFWTPRFGTSGALPTSCAYSSPLQGDQARLVPGGPSAHVNRMTAFVAAPTDTEPGRWMRASATIHVTSCAAEQYRGTCRPEDRKKGTFTRFLGKLLLRDANGDPYPASCVQLAGGVRGWQKLDVSGKVHHDQLQFDLRFRVLPGCSPEVLLLSTVSAQKMKGATAGEVHDLSSQILVVVDEHVGSGR
ncbi:hypothetical protein [Cellulomonas sp. PSBB021]|uniref:hypothetical protein n=1 Tax=Cellulomonas sp. PSBB021 TaxID=2003551 RepID=UPI0012FD5CE1|nr:hypothetical protein [Cellulomonas sp. PSBB021]